RGIAAQVYEVATGRAASPVLKCRDAHFTGTAAISPNGQMLITGSSDGAIRRWALPGGESLGRPLSQFTAVNLVCFSPHGRLVATAQRGGLVRLWALPSANPRDYAVPLEGGASLAQFSRDGRYLLSTSNISRARLRHQRVYEVATGQPAGPALESGGFIRASALSPDGLQVATLVSFPESSPNLP